MKPVAKYTIDKVRNLRVNRKRLKTNGSSGIFSTDTEYQAFLGELKGAGHLQVNGFESLQVEIDRGFPSFTNNQLSNPPQRKTYTMKYNVGVENGDKPHFSGYVQSASNADRKPYKVNAWINEGGNIRIEIVER
jgi:hypothetical protein